MSVVRKYGREGIMGYKCLTKITAVCYEAHVLAVHFEKFL